MLDWLAAFDDCLVLRWQRCILCHAPADRVELRSHDDFALAFAVCARCVQADATEARREAVVEHHATRHARQSAP